MVFYSNGMLIKRARLKKKKNQTKKEMFQVILKKWKKLMIKKEKNSN